MPIDTCPTRPCSTDCTASIPFSICRKRLFAVSANILPASVFDTWLQRRAFIDTIKAYKSDDLVYVDEAGINDTLDYEYGWCAASERFYDLKLGHRTQHISMIAGWCNRTILAPLTFTGYCNTGLVETWVESVLVPDLKPGQVVVMDNASFHKSATIEALIEQAGCRLLFLPPYSPDLNKIEKFWARLKHHLRKTSSQFEVLWDAVDNTFRELS